MGAYTILQIFDARFLHTRPEGKSRTGPFHRELKHIPSFGKRVMSATFAPIFLVLCFPESYCWWLFWKLAPPFFRVLFCFFVVHKPSGEIQLDQFPVYVSHCDGGPIG